MRYGVVFAPGRGGTAFAGVSIQQSGIVLGAAPGTPRVGQWSAESVGGGRSRDRGRHLPSSVSVAAPRGSARRAASSPRVQTSDTSHGCLDTPLSRHSVTVYTALPRDLRSRNLTAGARGEAGVLIGADLASTSRAEHESLAVRGGSCDICGSEARVVRGAANSSARTMFRLASTSGRSVCLSLTQVYCRLAAAR
jgi:hypothetical protein